MSIVSGRSIGKPAGAIVVSLTLYVAGDNAFSRQALANLQSIVVDAELSIGVRLIDVLKHPDVALEKRMFVTPALVIAHSSGTESLIIGDLSERAKVLRMLRPSGDADRSDA